VKNIIFIGGIHGVGKGWICAQLSKELNIKHLTASEVLKWTEISSSSNKLVDNVNETQDRLVNNLRKIVVKDEKYLLDGHYCLLNKDGEPYKIPFSTFSEINPNKLILVYEDTVTIKQRLQDRDHNEYSEDTLKKFQGFEIKYAEELSFKLSAPLLKIKSSSVNFDEIKKFIL
jgi:adenylate kinase